ncbi:DBH-like monooxygenase protein 1 isoform X2 [Tachypleus tridentatus]
MRVMYAFHEKDPDNLNTLSYHGNEHRGSRSIILVQPKVKRELPTEGVLHWDALSPNVTISHEKDTTYWCKIIKAPELTSMHHVIKIVPVVQSGNEGYVHHIVLYQCLGETPEKLETYLDHEGHECYHPNMPPVFRKCKGVMAAWGIGGETMVLPDHAGIPFGDLENRYFMIEVHYDNPALHKDVVDRSGLRLFYTKKLRKNDAVTLMTGAEVDKTVIIPPGQQKYVVAGHCGHHCLEKVIPEDGVKIFAVFPHSHLMGKEMFVRHFRNGSEFAPIVVDRNYDFNYQEYRYLPEEVTILPGDHLTVECVYDSTSRQTTTFGGFSTKDEMCLAFLLYYPKTNLSMCFSSPRNNLIAELTGYSRSFQSPPYPRKEMYYKYIRDYDWPKSFMPVIQGALRYGPHEQTCEINGASNEYQTELTTYPEAEPYKTISPCRSPDMKAHAITHQNLDLVAPQKSTDRNGVERLKRSHVHVFTTLIIFLFTLQKLGF